MRHTGLEATPTGTMEDRVLLERALEALRWCGGSGDFQEDGQAYVGWELMVRPVLADLEAAIGGQKSSARLGAAARFVGRGPRRCAGAGGRSRHESPRSGLPPRRPIAAALVTE